MRWKVTWEDIAPVETLGGSRKTQERNDTGEREQMERQVTENPKV